jgi:hypothetical protein
MAEVKGVVQQTVVSGQGLRLVKWENVNAGDTILPVVCAEFQDKTAMWSKGSAFGGNAGLEGSLDPDPATARFAVLNDPNGNPLSGFTADRVENVLEHVYLIRPTAAAGVAGVDVWLLLASARG